MKENDNLEEFGPVSSEDLEIIRRNVERLFTQTNKALLSNFGGTSFGVRAPVKNIFALYNAFQDFREYPIK